MTAHTPGPWTASCFLVTAGHDRITHCGGNLPNNRSHEAEANARLIAAAPEMADALSIACIAMDLARIGCHCSVAERASGHHVDCYVPEIKEAIEAARGVLAKAGL